jgi:hypothetical protein
MNFFLFNQLKHENLLLLGCYIIGKDEAAWTVGAKYPNASSFGEQIIT